MEEESISQECRLNNIDETRKYFVKEIEQNELMSKKHKSVSTIVNYIEHFLVLASAIIECVSIFVFTSLLGTLIGISSSTIRLKVCAITTGIKKYKPIVKK